MSLRFRVDDCKPKSTWFAAVRFMGVPNGPIDQLQVAITDIAAKVSGSNGHNSVKNAIKWPFQKKEAQRVLDKIERMKLLINLAFQEDLSKLVFSIKADVQLLTRVDNRLEALNLKIEELVAKSKDDHKRLEKERVKIINWISRLNFNSTQHEVLSKRAPNTGSHFLNSETFAKWLGKKGQTLWCHGIPGGGKTVFAATVVDHLHQVFAKRTDIVERHLKRERFPESFGNRSESFLESSSSLMLWMSAQWTMGNDDVEQYVRYRISKEGRLGRHVARDPALEGLIIKEVQSRTQHMFLLAQLHIDALATKPTRRALENALRTLPKELDQTYDEAMRPIYNQNEDDRELAWKILTWIALANRPLSKSEIQHALAVFAGDRTFDEMNVPDEELLTSVRAGLISIDAIDDTTVRLIHYTAQEYFERLLRARIQSLQSEV
ncbi:hypothetical protein QBC38DRAFT_502318 [Podospora fimiseda]|uniref:Uncharacterized protein n=1 Tax=Podospora fimiseda TaxID=252190 RepID=A0AAN7BJC1_9PEZI|nr:hypothetical protein QBC38DRAFT_502318 [Podospora fimiseda]